MRSIIRCYVIITALALPLMASTEVEIGTITTIYPTGNYAFAYNPTAIAINNSLFLYVQVVDPECTSQQGQIQGDVIYAFRATLTNGIPGTFQAVGRISPCALYNGVANHFASFGPGQIFQATVGGVTAYHLLADMSDQSHFNEIWHGWTTDGTTWTWEVDNQPACPTGTCNDPVPPAGGHTKVTWKAVPHAFIVAPFSLIVNPIVISTNPLVNNHQWWGYLKFWNGVFNTTEMLVDFDSAGNPTVSVLTQKSNFGFTALVSPPLQACSWQGGTVTSGCIDQATNTAMQTNGNLAPNFNAKSLLGDPTYGGFQLWGDTTNSAWYDSNNVSCAAGFTTDTSITCTSSDGWGCPVGQCGIFGQCQALGTPGIAFDSNNWNAALGTENAYGSTFTWFPVLRFSFGASQFVGSQSRYMPSGYGGARLFPARWNSSNGNRYLFSSTSDDTICSHFNGPVKIVQSQVQLQP